MEMMVAFITLLLGLAVGAFIVWFSKEGQAQQAVAAAQAENLATIAALEEKAAALTQREGQLTQELSDTRRELDQRRLRSEEELNLLRQEAARLREEQVQLQGQLYTERQTATEKQRVLTELEERFTQAIGSASQQALEAASQQAFANISEKMIEGSSQSFLEMTKKALEEFRPLVETARSTNGHSTDGLHTSDPIGGHQLAEMVRPLDDTLRKVEEQLRAMERERTEDYQNLLERVKELGESQSALRAEAGRLAGAMRSPAQRGLWGEVQLRRVVEMAGMLEHCEFRIADMPVGESDETVEVPTVDALLNGYHPGEGRNSALAADLTVHLPGGRSVVVNSGAPVESYMEALSATDDTDRDAKLALHAASLRAHVDALSTALSEASMPGNPDFVVGFLPGEAFLSAALAQDPGLLEYSLGKRVLLTTPTTLVSLLKTASYGWRQEGAAENARQIRELGHELYDRLRVLTGHFNGIKRGLETTLRAYNDAAASMEARVLPTARRFHDSDAGGGPAIHAPVPISLGPSELHLPELRALVGASTPNGEGA